MIEFQEITIADRDIFRKFTLPKEIDMSFYNFTNIFMWRNYANYRYAIVDGFLCTIACMGTKDFAFYPLGQGVPEKPVKKLIEQFGNNIVFMPLTTQMADELKTIAPGQFDYTSIRNQSDYIYKTEKMISLAGKKLHAKRNHINKFKKLYQYEYVKITKEIIPDCIRAEEQWLDKHEENKSVNYEKQAILDVFEHFDTLGLTGGALKVDGKIIAFSIGEPMTKNTALLHIEKADINYEGAYAMINQQFAEHEWSGYEYLNREEDMGVPGLRKAKMSYYPDKLMEVIWAIPRKEQ